MSRDLTRCLILIVACFALHGPGLGREELDKEEGRRALPAREMLEHRDPILPTLFGEPYLAKPPGYFWTVAAFAVALERTNLVPERSRDELGWSPPEHGPVTPLAVRLPSLWAAALGAVALVLLGARLGSSGAGTFAAVLWITAPNLARKVRLGEIETALTVACFLAGAALWLATRGPRARPALVVVGGLLTGYAVLLKGPIALLFALWPAVVGAGPRRPLRGLLAVLAATGVAAGLVALWLVPLLARFEDRSDLLALWSDEIARDPSPGLGTFLFDRWRLISGSLLGWLPASLLVGIGLLRRRSTDWMRGPLAAILLPAVVLLLWPGVRARYAMPMLPWVALAAGGVAADLVARRRAAGRAALAPWLVVLGVVAVLWRGVQLSWIEPARADRDRRVETAGRLDELTGGTLWIQRSQSFNTLYYVRGEVRAVADPEALPSGAVLLRGPAAEGELDDAAWERLEPSEPTPELAVFDLWRRR